ncbi:hypothetical protein H0H92_011071 [Tricholoma furcatifolium]|nr:hypothetical protein H0H92_011071 [Tricholoma furcatifolium]
MYDTQRIKDKEVSFGDVDSLADGPREFGLYEGQMSIDWCDMESCGSFQQEMNSAQLVADNITDSLRDEVNSRDKKKCFFTGKVLNEADLALTWIVPPSIYHIFVLGYLEPEKEKADLKKHANLDNVLTMHKDFLDVFQRNDIMVDVDRLKQKDPNEENMKVFYFSLEDTLKERLVYPERKSVSAETIHYLRRHLSRGLLEGMKGGGMAEDYDRDDVWSHLNDTPWQDLPHTVEDLKLTKFSIGQEEYEFYSLLHQWIKQRDGAPWP